MPRPDRSMGGMPPGATMGPPIAPGMQGGMPSGGVISDIRALNSSILLITQKLKYIVRNEKIIGRNLIVLNKKIKALEDKVNSPQKVVEGGASSEETEKLRQKVSLLEAQIEDIRSRTATKEELKELKYIIDSINPLEYTTLSQVSDLIDKKTGKKKE